ncbi:hypothetical protein V8F20_008131 [Naviculisporaceae sp. PSN 640]
MPNTGRHGPADPAKPEHEKPGQVKPEPPADPDRNGEVDLDFGTQVDVSRNAERGVPVGDPVDIARQNAEDQAKEKAIRATEENNSSLDGIVNTETGEEHPAGGNPSELLPDYSQFFKEHEKASRAILRDYCVELNAGLKSEFPSLAAQQPFTITPESLIRLMKSPDAHLVGILDFRSHEINADDWGRKIKGSVNFELPEGLSKMMLDYGEARGIEPDEAKKAKRKANWTTELAKPDSPFLALARKPIIVAHCRQSRDRTPNFMGGYIRYIAKPRGQRVAILQGGFEAFAQVAGPDLGMSSLRITIPEYQSL